MMRPYEYRDFVVGVAEEHPATTWLEAAERLLDQQQARHRSNLDGDLPDRNEARKHLVAIEKIRTILRSDKSLKKAKIPYEDVKDPLVRKMRRADLLCPSGWRDGIRKLLVDTANACEREYLDPTKSGLDQDIVDAVEIRAFIAELDFVDTRGRSAREEYSRRAMKVA